MAGDLYKDKIEVSLDGRQIFYLFFGGAVIVGLVFVLGVMVGKRVEARGHVDKAQTQTATDPLAALDRLEGSGGLTFQSSLAGGEPVREVDKTIAAIEKARQDADKPKDDKKKADKPKDDKKLDQHADAKKPEPKVEDKKPEPKADDKKPEVAKADKKPDDKKDEPKPKDDRKKKDDKGRFTLQLSSFQDRSEADAFVSSIKAAGFQPYITEAEVDGKGTFYRVRVGSYHTLDAANDAKSELDRNLKKPAQVMKL